MKDLIKKYRKEVQELMKWKARLATEYSRTEREETKKSFEEVTIQIKVLLQVIEDLKNIEEKGDE